MVVKCCFVAATMPMNGLDGMVLDQLQEGDEAADGQADQCQETQDRGQPPVYVGFHS